MNKPPKWLTRSHTEKIEIFEAFIHPDLGIATYIKTGETEAILTESLLPSEIDIDSMTTGKPIEIREIE